MKGVMGMKAGGTAKGPINQHKEMAMTGKKPPGYKSGGKMKGGKNC